MPTEQSQVEYYHYYRASQRRVRQWVQSTSRELEATSNNTAATPSESDLPLIVGGEDGYGDAEGGGGNNSSGLRRRGSRRRSSSSSKPQIHDQQVDTSRSRGPSSRSRSTRKKDVRSRKPYSSSDGLTTSSLLSLGLFPLIFVLTPPSVATLFSATILLAGYFSVDYRKKESISEKL